MISVMPSPLTIAVEIVVLTKRLKLTDSPIATLGVFFTTGLKLSKCTADNLSLNIFRPQLYVGHIDASNSTVELSILSIVRIAQLFNLNHALI